jgi:hypothetical protein
MVRFKSGSDFSLAVHLEEVAVRPLQYVQNIILNLAIFCLSDWQFADTKSLVSNLDLALILWFFAFKKFDILSPLLFHLRQPPD